MAALAAAAGLVLDPPTTTATVTGVTLDSRRVMPGDLYAALPGAHAHGAEFVGQAARAGATAVLTDPQGAQASRAAGLATLVADDPRSVLGAVAARVYGRPGEKLLLIGATGTNGKTTTVFLIEAGLRAAGHLTGLVGTVETRVAGEVVDSVRTTPEAPEMQAMLRLLAEWDPVLYGDLHVTDGAKFQPDVAVSIEPLLAGPPPLREIGRSLRDALFPMLEKQGHHPLPFYPSFETESDPASGFGAGAS